MADVDLQLAKLLESQSLATTTRREYTDEEKKIREAILSQYSQLSDNEVTNVILPLQNIYSVLHISFVILPCFRKISAMLKNRKALTW